MAIVSALGSNWNVNTTATQNWNTAAQGYVVASAMAGNTGAAAYIKQQTDNLNKTITSLQAETAKGWDAVKNNYAAGTTEQWWQQTNATQLANLQKSLQSWSYTAQPSLTTPTPTSAPATPSLVTAPAPDALITPGAQQMSSTAQSILSAGDQLALGMQTDTTTAAGSPATAASEASDANTANNTTSSDPLDPNNPNNTSYQSLISRDPTLGITPTSLAPSQNDPNAMAGGTGAITAAQSYNQNLGKANLASDVGYNTITPQSLIQRARRGIASTMQTGALSNPLTQAATLLGN